MKNNRLFGIIYLLLSKETITAKELAEYFEVSTRTIYRDIDALSEMNIPIYMSKGKNGGIHLMEHYKFDKALLNDHEQQQILFSLQELSKLNADNQETYKKMKSLFSQNDESWFEVDFSVWGNSYHHKIRFDQIKTAILEKRIIKFLYFNSYENKAQRIVEPLKLIFKHNSWYLFGYDQTKQDTRLFKITRIRDLILTELSFTKRPQIEEKKVEQSPHLISLILEIDSCCSFRVYDEFDEASIKVLENGNFLINQTFPFSDWIFGFILSFSNHIRVIEPEFIKEEIITRLQKSLTHYL